MWPDGKDEIIQRSSILHSARTSHGEQASNRDFTLGAAASEADLAPLYGATQRSLSDVIGRFDAFVAQEGEEPFRRLTRPRSAGRALSGEPLSLFVERCTCG
jgi:hypothetical protein